MPLNMDLIGVRSDPVERRWTSTDTLLYALGAGAGQMPELDELAFTTENSSGVRQRALPTFAVLAASARSGRKLGDFDPAMLVHAEQSFELHRELPVEGSALVTSMVTAVEDKGSGALVTVQGEAVDSASGERIVTSSSSMFIRGEGGFGRSTTAGSEWRLPERSPDARVTYPTRTDQALLYRLSGDRNPLHSDPTFAARAGFPRPILHGLCTYAITGRALLHEVCDSDPARFASMSGRFSRPVFPGQELTISIWQQDDLAMFQTSTDKGDVVIDRGTMRAT